MKYLLMGFGFDWLAGDIKYTIKIIWKIEVKEIVMKNEIYGFYSRKISYMAI